MQSKTQIRKDIDAYLASQPQDFSQALQRIREIVQETVADADEAFVYGVPGFKLNGKSLVCYAGFKNHCGFYPLSPVVIQSFASELEKFDIAKGTIRFRPEMPIPKGLIKQLLKARVVELEK
jgi:uncharacterized protein YdhG (YjbR/CyaY superfamily)